ncbi:type 1 glutamine amidotransferase [Rhizobium sp. RU36D]|uniref:type 1 glutamine amidotransferase n=1 Tax=Rhizobium sp. RU36D TaxID=1907415 RepID=UPI0009D8EB61|nr:type 1 glutamine amidotransferase [Rhizobium sp. RU36D]SMD20770.1 GMP synthase-Glutamine amidotransferase [Rhizobium sp. RU36D]
MRVAIIENMAGTHHGLVGVALAEAGAKLDVIRPYEGQPLPASTGDHDALVVFGGEQNARDDAKHPYLGELAALMRDFGDEGRPVLGICLGSQMLARAYGAENLIGAAPEFGWRRIELTGEAGDDPVLSAVPSGFTSFQWHDDTFTLPPGAVRLAENGVTPNQAFRVGRAAYGMQFHFEANLDVVERWKAAFPEVIERKEPGWLGRYEALAAHHGPQADATGLAIARAWVGLIGRGSIND